MIATVPEAVLSVLGQEVRIRADKTGLKVEAQNADLKRIASQAVSFAAKRYTPALGGPIAFIARDVSEQMGGEVVSVNEYPSKKGRVF